MSIKNSIKDGQGSNLEACVKETLAEENSLCTNMSGVSSGVVIPTVPFAAGGQTDGYLTKDSDGVTINAAVNGTLGSPIIFQFDPFVGKDFIITEISIISLDVGIKLNNWIGANGPITNGCILEVKADSIISSFDKYYKTLDLAAFASKGGFELLSEQGGDMVKSLRDFTPQFIIRAQDTFGTSASQQDYVKWTVQDSHSGITELRIQVRGFVTEPGVF